MSQFYKSFIVFLSILILGVGSVFAFTKINFFNSSENKLSIKNNTSKILIESKDYKNPNEKVENIIVQSEANSVLASNLSKEFDDDSFISSLTDELDKEDSSFGDIE